MLNHLAVVIGIGVGIAGFLFLLFQEDRQSRRLAQPHTSTSSSWDEDPSDPVYRSSDGPSPHNDVSCVICLDVDNLPASTLTHLRCGHRFHRQCINMWLSEGKGCPICRSG